MAIAKTNQISTKGKTDKELFVETTEQLNTYIEELLTNGHPIPHNLSLYVQMTDVIRLALLDEYSYLLRPLSQEIQTALKKHQNRRYFYVRHPFIYRIACIIAKIQ